MKHVPTICRVVLVLIGVISGTSGTARSQNDPCAGATGAAYGLCSAYCVYMECETPGQQTSAACQKVAAAYRRIVGSPLVCSQASLGLECTCSGGILSCSASGLESNVIAFLNIDLREYAYGENGISDALTDAHGNVQFPDFDLFTYLAAKNLTLSSVIMVVTNQPGMTLVQSTVPTCGR